MIVGRTNLVAALLCAAMGSAAVVTVLRNGKATLPSAHVDHSRIDVARLVAAAVRWADAPQKGKAADGPCEALVNSARRWQRALTGVRARLGLTAAIAVDAVALEPAARLGCEAQARRLDDKLRDALPLFAVSDRWADRQPVATMATDQERIVRIEPSDASTWNPFAVLPLQLVASDGGRVALGRDLSGERLLPASLHESIVDVTQDAMLAAGIARALSPARFTPVRQASLGDREVPAAARLVLTLDVGLQRLSASWVRCFTGSLSECAQGHAMPLSLLADPRLRVGTSAPRSPAAAMVVVDLLSGRIVAMTGAISKCSAQMLQRDAVPVASGKLAFAAVGDRCAQFPDRRHRYLLDEHAALWVVPPGSFAKVPVTAACLSSRHRSPAELAELRSQLARSDDNEAFRRLGLACALSFQRTWHGVTEASSIAFGSARWVAARARPARFEASNLLGPAEYEALARLWRASPRAEREVGPEMTARYLRSAAVASLAIGGGGMGMNTLSIAEVMRDLALRARGASQAPVMHLIRDADAALPVKSLLHFDTIAAAATLKALGAVTSASAGGTAHGACSRVLSRCPREGLADVAGKTGTADFTVSETSSRVKAGATALPAKVFGAVFEAGGRQYAAAAMVLRGREPDGRLELHGNAAAELVLLARQWLGNRPADGVPESEQVMGRGPQAAAQDNRVMKP
jgi:hypothetical protein